MMRQNILKCKEEKMCFSINTRAFMRRKYTYKRHHVGMFGVDLVPKLTPCSFHIIGKTSQTYLLSITIHYINMTTTYVM